MSIFIAGLFGIVFRYMVQRTQACLYWGRQIASPEYLEIKPNGFQNAISPPSWNLPFFASLVGTVLVVGYAFYVEGVLIGFGALIAAFVAGVIAGVTIIPKSDSQHFFESIQHDLANRSADFAKKGDMERAEAAKKLHEMLIKVASGYWSSSDG